eukprot:sb/3468325/
MSGKIMKNGKICEGRHPKICKKLRSGGFGKNGCTKGSKCEYLHPKVCRGSVSKEKTCTDPASCKFFHISGTRLSHPNVHQEKSNPPGAALDQKAEPVTPTLPVTMDFVQDLFREMKESFSAQAQQIQSLTRTIHSRESGSPMKPLFGDFPIPSQEQQILGLGATHPMSISPAAGGETKWKLPYIKEMFLSPEKHEPPVLAMGITETWLKSYISDAQVSIPGRCGSIVTSEHPASERRFALQFKVWCCLRSNQANAHAHSTLATM